MKNKMNKRGQVWSFDLIVAGIIFLIGMVILIYYALNFSPQSANQLEELFYQGNLASELILSEEGGGILSEGIVNQTKLDSFDVLSDENKRNFFGLNTNYYFVIDNLDMGGGRNSVGIMNTSSIESLVQITRLTIYKNKPVKFQLYVWK